MITIFAKTDGETFHIQLPLILQWAVKVPRLINKFTGLAGNSIIQVIEKNTSSGSASYSGNVDSDKAEEIDRLDKTASECFVSDGERVYKMSLDAQVSPSTAPGKKKVDIAFEVIRRII